MYFKRAHVSLHLHEEVGSPLHVKLTAVVLM